MDLVKMAGKDGIMVDLTETDFDDYVNKNKVVLVDFWAGWCMPCTMQGKMIEGRINDLPAGAKIAKVNVDENPGIARRFNVRGIPQMYLMVNGKSAKGWTGVTPVDELIREMKDHL
jgi:thioredoxin 1